MKLYVFGPEEDDEGNSPWDWTQNIGPWTAENDEQRNSKSAIGAAWRPLNLRIMREQRTGDFFGFHTHPIVTPRAWEVIQPIVGNSVEALPVRVVNGGPLLLLNVLHRIPLVEGTQTSWQGNPDFATLIHKFVLRERDLLDKIIFRPSAPGVYFDHCIVTESFKNAVLSGGLVGANFAEIDWHIDNLADDLAQPRDEPDWSGFDF